MGVIDAIRLAAKTQTAGEGAGVVTRAEAEAIVTVARASGVSEPTLRDAFAECEQLEIYRALPAPTVFAPRPSSTAGRIMTARESLECAEDFNARARSARRVIDGLFSRLTIGDYAALPLEARIGFWQAALLVASRGAEAALAQWATFSPELAEHAHSDLLLARATLVSNDAAWPSSAELDGAVLNIEVGYRAALASTAATAAGDPAPDLPSTEDIALFTRLTGEAALNARIGSTDRNRVAAAFTSRFFYTPDSFGLPRDPMERTIVESGLGTGAGLASQALGNAGFLLNVMRGVAGAADAYDRTSPDLETRYRAYLRDAVRRQANDNVEEETRIFGRLQAIAERLEAIRQWQLRHPDAVAHPYSEYRPG